MQFFCILLWCLDDYWQYSVFTLFMMLVFEGTVVMSRRKNIQTLSGMNNETRNIKARFGSFSDGIEFILCPQVFRDKTWASINAEDLVPGDIISVVRTSAVDEVVPCDCLLLRGSAIVNEATLTGVFRE